ncbi:unnamed protein product [Tenebrio molitor]|nr:unnamed protein product [Tenebrio molitor]
MDKVEWTVAVLEQLIDQYDQFPCLFDTKHKLYHNKHARTDAFHKIAEVLKERVPHITVEEVKKKLLICVRNTATSVRK